MTITVEGPGGVTVDFPDGTDTETISKVMTQHFGGGDSKPSGAVAGLTNATAEAKNALQETAKDYLGVGSGPTAQTDPNYVPADITHGSYNPLNWNYDQLPQKAAELAPGLTQNILAATAGAKAGKLVGGARGAAVGGILGSMASLWASSAGNAAKKDAQERTGDANAAPNASDLTRAGLTSAASSAAQSLLPTRFIPGANAVKAVGTEGVKQAAQKLLATTAIGGVSGAAGNAIDQFGNSIGTDKGVNVDPSQVLDAGIGNAAVAGLMGAPRGVADVASAARLSKFGGANADATAAYANRLQTAGEGKLGKEIGGSKIDFTAHKTAVDNIKNELRDAANNVRSQTPLGPDADNALQRAQEGKPITATDLALIDRATAAAPDGANASFLARQMHVAQQAEQLGSFDATHKKWSGGASGVLDKNLGFLLNPTRLVAGTAATGLGMHLLGAANPLFAGGLAGSYLGARAVDKLSGMRSPANAFAARFADAAQANRLPTTQPPAPPAPPSAPPVGPWGPRPLPQQSVPQVAPPGPPPQAAPQFSPIALSMLKQTLKTNAAGQLPVQQPSVAPAPPPPQGDIPWKAPTVTELPQFNSTALKMLAKKLKEAPPAPTPEQAPIVKAPWSKPTITPILPDPSKLIPQPAKPVNPLKLPADVTRPAKNLMKGLAQADARQQEAGATPPPSMPALVLKAKITKKSGGSVKTKTAKAATAAPQETAAPAADPWADVGAYTPVTEFPYKGQTPQDIASAEVRDRYATLPAMAKKALSNSIIGTRTARNNEVASLQQQFPADAATMAEMLDHLHAPGNASLDHSKRVIKHFTGLMSDGAAKATRDRFNSKAVQDAIWPKRQHKKKNVKSEATTPQEVAAE